MVVDSDGKEMMRGALISIIKSSEEVDHTKLLIGNVLPSK